MSTIYSDLVSDLVPINIGTQSEDISQIKTKLSRREKIIQETAELIKQSKEPEIKHLSAKNRIINFFGANVDIQLNEREEELKNLCIKLLSEMCAYLKTKGKRERGFIVHQYHELYMKIKNREIFVPIQKTKDYRTLKSEAFTNQIRNNGL